MQEQATVFVKIPVSLIERLKIQERYSEEFSGQLCDRNTNMRQTSHLLDFFFSNDNVFFEFQYVLSAKT